MKIRLLHCRKRKQGKKGGFGFELVHEAKTNEEKYK